MVSPNSKNALFTLVVILCGCGRPGDKGHIRPPEPLPQNATAGSAPTFRTYKDRVLSIRLPSTWDTTVVPSADAKLHMVDLRNRDGIYARITVVREANDPGSFPFQIIQNLKRANKSVRADRYHGRIGVKDARGYSYIFKIKNGDWKGWVLSYTQDRTEICFLGQYPQAGESAFKGKLQQVMNTLKVHNEKDSNSAKADPVTTTP